MSLALKVECYSGRKADERPLRFSMVSSEANQAARSVREVKEVLDQWYGPEYQCFKVLADDGNLYILRHNLVKDVWELDSFRQGSSPTGQKSKVES